MTSHTQLDDDTKIRYIVYAIDDVLSQEQWDKAPVDPLKQAVIEYLQKHDAQSPDTTTLDSGITRDDIDAVIDGPHVTIDTVNWRYVCDVDLSAVGARPDPLATEAPVQSYRDLALNPTLHQISSESEPDPQPDSDAATPAVPFDLQTLVYSVDGIGYNRLGAILGEQAQFSSLAEIVYTTPETLIAQTDLTLEAEARAIIQAASLHIGPDAVAEEARAREESFVTQRQSAVGANIAPSHDAGDIHKPAGAPTDKRFFSLPVLEDVSHPLRVDPSTVSPYYPQPLYTNPTDSADPDSTPSGSDDTEFLIEAVTRVLAHGNYMPNLVGPAGVGKSRMAAYIAAHRRQPLITLNLDGDILAEELFGIHHLEDANGQTLTDDDAQSLADQATDPSSPQPQVQTVWKDGPVPRAVRYGWMIVFNEINAAPPEVLLGLHSLLERDGGLYLRETNEYIDRHEQFLMITTMNPPDEGYHGVNELNAAFKSRLQTFAVDYLPEHKERQLAHDIINSNRTVLTDEQIADLCSLVTKFREAGRDDRSIPRLPPRAIYKIADRYDGGSLSLRQYVENYLRSIARQNRRQDPASLVQFARDVISEEYSPVSVDDM